MPCSFIVFLFMFIIFICILFRNEMGILNLWFQWIGIDRPQSSSASASSYRRIARRSTNNRQREKREKDQICCVCLSYQMSLSSSMSDIACAQITYLEHGNSTTVGDHYLTVNGRWSSRVPNVLLQ